MQQQLTGFLDEILLGAEKNIILKAKSINGELLSWVFFNKEQDINDTDFDVKDTGINRSVIAIPLPFNAYKETLEHAYFLTPE